MPYIRKWERKNVDYILDSLIKYLRTVTKDGEEQNKMVTYSLYKLVKNIYSEGNYEVLSNGLKVLESVKLEYYERDIKPYEVLKRVKNGDIEVI